MTTRKWFNFIRFEGQNNLTYGNPNVTPVLTHSNIHQKVKTPKKQFCHVTRGKDFGIEDLFEIPTKKLK